LAGYFFEKIQLFGQPIFILVWKNFKVHYRQSHQPIVQKYKVNLFSA